MSDGMPDVPVFDSEFQQQLERLVRWRRDVRHFRRDPVPRGVLEELLHLVAHAPSVGFSQPARFVLVESEAARAAVCRNFEDCNRDALEALNGRQAALYAQLKLAGLNQAPVHLAVFCDETTCAGHGLGRRTMPETVRYSVVAAIQTLWLALRAHGLGLGWVSILDPGRLVADLDVPRAWVFIAYCCIGYPEHEQNCPELLRVGWERRDARAGTILSR